MRSGGAEETRGHEGQGGQGGIIEQVSPLSPPSSLSPCLFSMPNAPFPNLSSQSLQDIAAVMPTAGYAYANKIAKLTKEIKIKAS